MLPAQVFLALVAFVAALLGALDAGRAATLHLILAVGAMPLIFGAMGHFIPVLTRTHGAPAVPAALAGLALAGGALAVSSFAVPALGTARYVGAGLAASAAALLLAWTRRRRRGMLGRPHPGLAWYEAALACLFVALLAILAGAIWPQHAVALRRLHLHLNTLGFIGLTAWGTLAVLLPTAAGKPDPDAAARLRRDLPWAVAGIALVATGAAWLAPLAAVGAAVLALPLARTATAWLRRYRVELFAWHGASPLLGAAFAGYAISLALGAAAAVRPSLTPTSAFVLAFLLPLVSGAASHLLPVWLRPGRQGDWHAALRSRLGRFAGARALLFCGSGMAAGLGQGWGLPLGGAVMLWFLLQAAAAVVRAKVFEKEVSA
ncbi:hypothetical protein [Thiobacillus sedimenti]|uniref:Uncharacterized protein n=1 Tax=Thiobacillus sedimenti TaxID=3110231 RepID=A0ABZ1CH48_9PROT|nr:hypothetical protein [Thiobacillus sp. SCUT-2]WRS38698.1 hypothetical protein VA613_11890 [Thiobacillus sp. SCUT-2]